MVSEDSVVQQLALEVQYAHGMLYFDRSGDALRQILRRLGPPFVPLYQAIPPLVATTAHSPTEYLTVDFDKDKLTIRQMVLATPLRVQESAREAWDVLAELFEVRRQVRRFGVRMLMTWRADTEEEVEAALVGSGLVRETESWEAKIGAPTKRAFTGIKKTASDQTRYHLANGTVKIEGPILENLKGFHAPQAILLDMDWSTGSLEPDQQLFALRGEDIKTRVREIWKQGKATSDEIGRLLAAWNARVSS